MRVALGSTSKHKINAVRRAFWLLGMQVRITSKKVSSGENEQPVGLLETLRGATARSKALQSIHPDMPCIGIESGIVNVPPKTTLDLAVIVVVMPDGKRYVATSSGITMPQECVQEARRRGYKKVTVGSVVAKRYGGDGTDPIATLTRKTLTRTDVLVTGLFLALAQIPQFQRKKS